MFFSLLKQQTTQLVVNNTNLFRSIIHFNILAFINCCYILVIVKQMLNIILQQLTVVSKRTKFML